MPQQSRKKRDHAAASQRKAGKTAAVPVPLQEQPPQPQREEQRKSRLYYILLIVPIVLLVASNSLVTFLYALTLDPLYGSVSVHFHLEKVVWAATIAGAFGPVPSLRPSFAMLGCLVASIPVTSYWTALYTGRMGNPGIGSLITHLVVLFPVIYFGVSLVKRITTVFETNTSGNTTARFTILPACATSIIGLQPLWGSLLDSYRFGYLDSSILRIIGGIFIVVYAFPSRPTSIMSFLTDQDRKRDGFFLRFSSSSFLTWLVVLILLPPLWLLNPPLVPQPMTGPYEHANFPLRILSSVPSVTGRIVVGESLPSQEWVPGAPKRQLPSLRYLRASHSILGGVWIGDKVVTRANSAPLRDAEGTPLGDPIYGAFVLQGAVLLADKTDRAIRSGQEKALVIGLGTGVVATSFARQNIDTTVIEIDPAIYNASRQYFGLPDLGSDRVFLEDARVVIAEKRQSALQYGISDIEKYDYVVHDCFSGGGVPSHLFTLQFWEDLKIIMNPDGILAVNFAGKIDSKPAKAILYTLQQSFGQCRVLHDLPPDQTDLLNAFVNLVFFCSPSTKPLSFRSPTETDYAGSYLRAKVFDTLREREVDMKLIRGDIINEDNWVLNDTSNRLNEWQKSDALDHWRLMRDVLPESLWVTY